MAYETVRMGARGLCCAMAGLLLICGAQTASAAVIDISASLIVDDLRYDFPAPAVPYGNDPSVGFPQVTVNATVTGLDPGERLLVIAGRLVGGIFIDMPLFQNVGGIYVPASGNAGVSFSTSPPPLYLTSSVPDINAFGFSLFFSLTGPAGATADLSSLVVSGFDTNRNLVSTTAEGAAPVPEPASLLLVGSGAATLLAKARRRRSTR